MDSAPTLTERRRLATQLEIAEAAARLFGERDAKTVTVEEIAAAAGVSPRTYYRYFPTKEDAVAPLLSVGAATWRAAIEEADDSDVRDSIARAIERVLTPLEDPNEPAVALTRGLLRSTLQDSALWAVWQRVNADSERLLASVIATRLGTSARGAKHDVTAARLLAAAATAAIRLSLESWSSDDAAATRPAQLAASSFTQLSSGVTGLHANR
ncbi:TetR/AcrR family transcriptional regulator [Microbacterium sp. ZW T5_56]|uniref:TetR/AcrR family transcriptional regulator n=1 Tax=Microbacterium sp. ZW T5_56 TaxID=3378081 RepID=UPI003851B6F3